MKEILAVICLLVILPALLLWLNDKLFYKNPLLSKCSKEGCRFRERLLNPDFSVIERHFGCELSAALKSLHANKEEILRSDFEIIPPLANREEDYWYVAFYNPADAQNTKGAWPKTETYFAFADDGCGNLYLIDPKFYDPPVIFCDHETNEITKVCDSFSEFMRWPRKQQDLK